MTANQAAAWLGITSGDPGEMRRLACEMGNSLRWAA